MYVSELLRSDLAFTGLRAEMAFTGYQTIHISMTSERHDRCSKMMGKKRVKPLFANKGEIKINSV
jgi:hypothetical protein